MADGGGKGHFTTLAEVRAAVLDHGKRIAILERDVIDLTDEVVKRRARRRRRKPKP